MTHELMRGYNRKPIFFGCAIQMDIQKIYDTKEWSVLEDIMKEINFPVKFINSIMICVSTESYKYSINDQHSDILKARRSLRQGVLYLMS